MVRWVFERAAALGGAVRAAECTRPGFRHDVLSDWHILFVESQAYRELKSELDAVGLTYGNSDRSAACLMHAIREAVADRVRARIGRHVEGLDELVLARTALSPSELERENMDLVGGDPYSGELDLEQNPLFRPLSVDAPHQTTVCRLFHIGASTYPGPGLAALQGRLSRSSSSVPVAACATC